MLAKAREGSSILETIWMSLHMSETLGEVSEINPFIFYSQNSCRPIDSVAKFGLVKVSRICQKIVGLFKVLAFRDDHSLAGWLLFCVRSSLNLSLITCS